MFNDINSYAMGAHVWLFREGDAFTLPAPGFAGVAALPGPTDPAWISSGDIEEFEDHMAQDEEKEVRRPNPGALVRKDIITIFQGLDFKWVTNSLSRISMEAFYRSATELSGAQTQFVPLSSPPRKCWVKIQRYTQENDPVFAADLWMRVKVTGGVKSGNGQIIMPEFTGRLLDSSLNTAAFGAL
jgi:hypothetical protein